jgi:hypothetical protein
MAPQVALRIMARVCATTPPIRGARRHGIDLRMNFCSPTELSSAETARPELSVSPRELCRGGAVVNPWFSIASDAVRLGIEAQSVIALRLARLSAGGTSGHAEAHRMVTEKLDAFTSVQMALAVSLLTGHQAPAIARQTIGIYGKHVRANRRRLSRG